MVSVKTLLLTRPMAQSNALAKTIVDKFPRQANLLISPLIEIANINATFDIDGFQALIFTSANGVRSVLGNVPLNTTAICVGKKTASAAKDAGMNVISADGDVEDLLQVILARLDPTAGPVLHIRGEHAVGDLVARLRKNGFDADVLVSYRQKSLPVSAKAAEALEKGEVGAIALYSPRTARLLLAEFEKNPLWNRRNITLLCISENVASEVSNAGFGAINVAGEPSGEKMLDLIFKYLANSGPSLPQ